MSATTWLATVDVRVEDDGSVTVAYAGMGWRYAMPAPNASESSRARLALRAAQRHFEERGYLEVRCEIAPGTGGPRGYSITITGR